MRHIVAIDLFLSSDTNWSEFKAWHDQTVERSCSGNRTQTSSVSLALFGIILGVAFFGGPVNTNVIAMMAHSIPNK